MNNKPNHSNWINNWLGLIVCGGFLLFIIISVLLDMPIEILANLTLTFLYGIPLAVGLIWLIRYNKKRQFNYKYKKILLSHTIPPKFQELYKNLYNNNIHKFETIRIKVFLSTVVQFMLFPMTFVILFVTKNGFLAGLWFLITVFIYPKFDKIKLKYKKAYKAEIISSLIKLFNNNLTYMSKTDKVYKLTDNYLRANFDKITLNDFTHDDYIEGNLTEDTHITFADINVNSNPQAIFRGIFAFTNTNKNIQTSIKIAKNGLKIIDNENRVEMDSKEFEKYFDVYSNDKILSMRLLTADIMQLLTDFYKKYQIDFEINFKEDNIYLRFHTGPMFEPKVFAKSMDVSLLFAYYFILQFVTEITIKINSVLDDIEL